MTLTGPRPSDDWPEPEADRFGRTVTEDDLRASVCPREPADRRDEAVLDSVGDLEATTVLVGEASAGLAMRGEAWASDEAGVTKAREDELLAVSDRRIGCEAWRCETVLSLDDELLLLCEREPRLPSVPDLTIKVARLTEPLLCVPTSLPLLLASGLLAHVPAVLPVLALLLPARSLLSGVRTPSFLLATMAAPLL